MFSFHLKSRKVIEITDSDTEYLSADKFLVLEISILLGIKCNCEGNKKA